MLFEFQSQKKIFPEFLLDKKIGTIGDGDAPSDYKHVVLQENDYQFEREMLREHWSKVTHRLDFMFLILFSITNIFVMFGTMIIGNSKLNV
jgi:hypothetical protein